MKQHGYKGAGDISKRVGRVYGWEATTEEVDDWIFDDIARTFVLDEENRKFFEENNPWAMEEIGRKLLEAKQRACGRLTRRFWMLLNPATWRLKAGWKRDGRDRRELPGRKHRCHAIGAGPGLVADGF